MSENLVEVRNLKKYFPIKKGVFKNTVGYVKAVDDISFTIQRGKVLGLVGESGCGKSTTGRTLLRLLSPTSGEVLFDGQNVFKVSKRDMRPLRTKMQIIFQDPYSSLNPRLPVYDIVGEAMLQHKIVKNKAEMKERVIDIIGKCDLFPEQATRYPHQFSGGQRQRICIARALAVNPEFIVCDEAVSALDVSIQSQIINLLIDLKERHQLTYLFISHDLSTVKFISDRVGVMYLGNIIELGESHDIYADPLHPYTEALLQAIPTTEESSNKELQALEGDIPSPINPPSGCKFHTRCRYATDLCKAEYPAWREYKPRHFVACHYPVGESKAQP